MADEIFQKRTYELAEFVPLTQGEVGWEDPATIWVPVDKVTWAEAKKINLLQFISDLHKEQNIQTLVGNEVLISEYFDTDFTTINYYIKIDAFRITTNAAGDSIYSNIPIMNFNKRVDGFTIELYDYKPGDIIKYIAFE